MDITAIKNDYVTNTSLTSQLNNLKSQRIATEVTGIDNKAKKNASDILTLENYYIHDYSMKGIENTKKEMPILKNDEKLYVYLKGNHFQQNNVLTSNNDHVLNKNVVNIYIVYKLDPLASTRDKSFTIQNALFGAMQITKNATDNDKNNYKGYGICFDERGEFGHTITEGGRAHTTDARNILIFGADMSFCVHATNRANHIYLMGTRLTQGINDTTIYAEKNFYRNFTNFGKNLYYVCIIMVIIVIYLLMVEKN